MIQYEDKTWLTTQEACSVLNRSMEALRQMIYRKKFTMKKIGSRIYLDNIEVMAYFPKKMGLPSFETLDNPEDEKYFTLDHVIGLLNYSRVYLKTLIKNGKLKAYCTADGQFLIPKQSLDNYMGVSDNADDI